jgi:hypothetical protein
MALGFFGASPYILFDWARFKSAVMGVSEHLAGGHGAMLGRGWPYFALVVLPAGLGWPMLVAGVAGISALLISRVRDAVLLFAFPVAYYLVVGRGYTVFARYIVPVIPFLCIGAAWSLVTAMRWMTRNAAPVARGAAIAAAAAAIVAPTAIKTVQLDRLLATPDNRVVVAQELLQITPSASLYQSGERYGYVPMTLAGRQVAHTVSYDADAGRFEPGEPDWVLVQRSPLTSYSAVPASLERLLREHYQLTRQFPTGDERPRLYDQQDAFYLPLGSLDGLARPGPSFDLYRKR